MMSISSGSGTKKTETAAMKKTTGKASDAAMTDSMTMSAPMATGSGTAMDMTAGQVQNDAMTTAAATGKPEGSGAAANDMETATVDKTIHDDTISAGQPEGTRPTSWILEQPADQYTIQLISTLQDDTLPAFINRNQLSGQTAYFRKRIKGQTRHILIYGVYPDTATARAAIEELPDAVRRTKPWVIGIGSVQQAINEFNNTH